MCLIIHFFDLRNEVTLDLTHQSQLKYIYTSQEAHAIDARIAAGETGRPLFGVPVSIKDLIETKGIRTTFGSLLLQDFVPEQDAVLVERLRTAGCPLSAKTNTPEYGGKFTTDNPLFGTTYNPWDLSRSPSGSSGGAAAQIAAGMGPLAIRFISICCFLADLSTCHNARCLVHCCP